MVTIEACILWFVFYSVVGWCYEVVICSIKHRIFVNRGFLFGPYCPIYGFGAVVDIIVLRGIVNPVVLFLSGAILACVLEYATSWGLETLFHNRWWDYSDKLLNLNGRVCLLGAVVFGAFAVLLIKAIHPLVSLFIYLLPHPVARYTSVALLALILEDGIYSAMSFSTFSKKVKALSAELAAGTHRVIRETSRRGKTLGVSMQSNIALDKLKAFIKRKRAGK